MNPSGWNQTDAFYEYFTGEEAKADWDGHSTLFVMSSGINDMVRSNTAGWDYPSMIDDILEEYVGQAKRLYDAGGVWNAGS